MVWKCLILRKEKNLLWLNWKRKFRLISFSMINCITFIQKGSVFGYKYTISKRNIVPLSIDCYGSLPKVYQYSSFYLVHILQSSSIFWEAWIPQTVGHFWYSLFWRWTHINVNTLKIRNALAALGSSLMWWAAISMLLQNSSPLLTRWIWPCTIIKEMKFLENTMKIW